MSDVAVKPEDQVEIYKVLRGEDYSVIIEKDTTGITFEYRLIENVPEGTKENVVIQGDGYDSIDAVIEDLSYLHNAFRSIFG